MSHYSIKETFWKNLSAEIDMLTDIIRICPDTIWQNEKKIFYMSYHSIIFLDYYLTHPVKNFHPQLDYTLADPDNLPAGAIDDVLPDQHYSKDQLIEYLSAIRKKAQTSILEMPETSLGQRWIQDDEIDLHGLCPSIVKNYNLLEILFYNMRHMQHHIGQLNLLLRQKANIATDWIAEAQ